MLMLYSLTAYMLSSGSGSGSGVGVLTTTDGGGVGTTVSWDNSGSRTEGSGVDILSAGDWAAGGDGTGVDTGVPTSDIYKMRKQLELYREFLYHKES